MYANSNSFLIIYSIDRSGTHTGNHRTERPIRVRNVSRQPQNEKACYQTILKKSIEMKALRLLLIAAVVLAAGCVKDEKGSLSRDAGAETPNETPENPAQQVGTMVGIKWESITQFNMSDVNRIDVTTEIGTEQCCVADCQTTIPYEFTTVDSVRVYVPFTDGSILVGPGELTYSDNVIDITLDLSGFTFVPDRASLESIRNPTAAIKGNYIQTADIDLSEADWIPIASDWRYGFKGVYDGNGFAIRNMHVNEIDGSTTSSHFCGFIGSNDGTIRDIRFENCSVNANVIGDVYCGGVCAVNYGSIISCSYDGTLNAKGRDVYLGGICGENVQNLFMCSNSGSGVAEAVVDCWIGGISGINMKYLVSSCNSGSICGGGKTVYCGGLCGINNSSGKITACFSSGSPAVSVAETSLLGTLCGINFISTTTISYCYWADCTETQDPIGQDKGNAIGLVKFGNGAEDWPDGSIPGWGPVEPDCWTQCALGTWSNPWKSLGGLNGASPVYPVLFIN